MKKAISQPVPPPVTIAALKQHFKTTYQLREDQVELMLQSSRKSMDTVLAAAEDALRAEDVCGRLGDIGHSLKGLLLNMGQSQWAEVARDLEVSARAGEARDYPAVITVLNTAMAAVMTYGKKS